jgi:hypothetical protein
MINLFRKLIHSKHRGAATILITVILLSVSTLIVLFAANYGVMQQKASANSYRYYQAYEAAEAGLEFAIPYLQKNKTTILAGPVGGYIPAYSDSSTANVTLGNNSKYTIVYSNPIANNYDLIKITVTGTSDDGTSSQVISQLVKFDSFLSTTPNSPLTAKGAVTLKGSAQVNNPTATTNIVSGSTISIEGSASTTTNNPGITSTASGLSSDVTQNNSSLSSMTPDQMFLNYFGVSQSEFKNSVSNYYSNSSDTNYNSALNGKTNTMIWIDQTGGTAKLDGSTVIGSATQPVILVVNGDLRLAGTATIYGLVFVLGEADTDSVGSSNIYGALINTGSLSLNGSAQVNYSTSTLNSLNQNIGYFAKVPGSWVDF